MEKFSIFCSLFFFFRESSRTSVISFVIFPHFFPPLHHFSLTFVNKMLTSGLRSCYLIVLLLPSGSNVEKAHQFTANSSSALSSLSVDLIRSGIDILVGTPGRIKDHLQNGKLDLTKVKHVVLDEVDQMLDMGFAEQVEDILRVAYKKGNLNISSNSRK